LNAEGVPLWYEASLGCRETGKVPRYFFDTRDGDKFIRDDEGFVFDTIHEARDEATAGLADMAKDAIPGRVRRELSVEVRDAANVRLIRASLWFEVQPLTVAA
jgi:hypothetical protein